MGKKKQRAHAVSKGERSSISKSISRAVRADRTYLDKYNFKVKAWSKGQNPWITIPNPDKNATNKLYIRVRARDLLGDPRPPKIDFNKVKVD